MDQPKVSLIWKLVLVNLLGVGLTILLIWEVINYFASAYFMSLMQAYQIEPEILHQIFLKATHQFLLISGVLGLGVVTLLSYFMTKRVLRSLTEMTAIALRLSEGDYSRRVTVLTRDEVGKLGKAFNRMLESLARIEAMRKELVANVAHELRTPLNNLKGELEAIQDGLIPLSKDTVRSLQEEILRLVHLVEALHRLSLVDKNVSTLKKESFDFSAVILGVLRPARERMAQKNIQFDANLKPMPVLADHGQMTQVIQNLVENILQYTPKGGEAGVKYHEEAGQLAVTFSNSGEGISKEDRPHIFERFFRAEKSRARESGGSGIGLAIVRQIIEAHGGKVGAQSRPGCTDIFFTLPFSSESI